MPPGVVDSVLASGDVGEVFEPPGVMGADLAVAPFRGSHVADDFAAFEIWEVEQPVIAFARDGAWIVPVVVAFAVRRKVDVAAGG